jgi:hypothetical protein
MRTLLVATIVAVFVPNSFAAEPGDQSIDQLRQLLPSQSHAMMDVEYHFANLWFAARESNWPLATFYLNESRSHVEWTVRLRPVRKLASGQDLDLKPLLDAFEHAGVDALRTTLERKDSKAFQLAYRNTLQLCYACHVAAEKPFLKPEVPREPAARLIQMHPQ